jgi:hypothetical protein
LAEQRVQTGYEALKQFDKADDFVGVAVGVDCARFGDFGAETVLVLLFEIDSDSETSFTRCFSVSSHNEMSWLKRTVAFSSRVVSLECRLSRMPPSKYLAAVFRDDSGGFAVVIWESLVQLFLNSVTR